MAPIRKKKTRGLIDRQLKIMSNVKLKHELVSLAFCELALGTDDTPLYCRFVYLGVIRNECCTVTYDDTCSTEYFCARANESVDFMSRR